MSYVYALHKYIFDPQTKKKIKQEREQSGEVKKVPHTLETLREKDETTVQDLNSEENLVVKHDLETDEFKDFYSKERAPKVLITYCDNPMKVNNLHNYINITLN